MNAEAAAVAARRCEDVDCLQRPAVAAQTRRTMVSRSRGASAAPQTAVASVAYEGVVGLVMSPGVGEGLPPPHPSSRRGTGVMIESLGPARRR